MEELEIFKEWLEDDWYQEPTSEQYDIALHAFKAGLKANKEPVAEVPCSAGVIKPCPFCGGNKIDFFKREFVDSVHTIECMGCWAQMSKNSELEALEAWNRRAL